MPGNENMTCEVPRGAPHVVPDAVRAWRPPSTTPERAGSCQACSRRRTRKAAYAATVASASTTPVSMSWIGQKCDGGW
jgi:hypothetical protein